MISAFSRSSRPVILSVGLLIACGTPDDPGGRFEPVFDLAAEFASAEIVSEVRAITFDSEASRRHLGAGWSRSEHDARRGRGFAWGIGEASIVELPLLAPRSLELTLEGRPFRFPGAPQQAVAVVVNGRRVDEIELLPEIAAYTVTLPEDALVAGANVLELRYRWNRSPREMALSDDRRSLAVAWFEIRCAPGEAVAARSQLGDPARLFVPFGTEVAYFIEAPRGGELRLPHWVERGGAGRLEVLVQGEHEVARQVGLIDGSGAGATFELPGDRRRLVRLALRATAKGETSGAAGLLLEGAKVWKPISPAVAPLGMSSEAASLDPPSAVLQPNPPRPNPNIVLYLIDTLRADHLGCYGYERPVSPRIDAFAERAVLFEHAVAQSSWTRSSMASIFTGRWPPAHGTNGRSDRLSAAAQTLPERLQAVGYRTAAFVTNPNLTAGFGFDQGFDDFAYLTEEAGSDVVHRAAVEWLGAEADDRPFFLYLHTLDPHAPYTAPETFRQRMAPRVAAATAQRSMRIVDDLQAGRIEATETIAADLSALYDAEIAFNDQSFGALLDELEARGLFEDALLILASDHGEEFHEHGNWQHGRALHGESIDVPLIVKLPRDRGGRRIAQRVQHVDLLPTVLAYLGLPQESELEGRSLLPWLNAEDVTAAETRVFSYLHLDGRARLSVLDEDWKLIQSMDRGELIWPRLYRLGEDRGELENLAEQYPVRAGYLAALMRRKLALGGSALPTEDAAIDDDVRKSLEALGYLD